ncbi:MAG: hypothetical protein M3Y58_12070 [Chloroflexota bacterium]|nr:hypothetical protein [Chloroflexota bacterium]
MNMIAALQRIALALAFVLLALVGAVASRSAVVPVGAAMTRHVTTCDGSATAAGSLPNVVAVNANVTAALCGLAILNGQGSRQCIGGNFPPNPLCGGGLFTVTGSVVTVTNCTIEGNVTANNGGGSTTMAR